MACGTSLDLKPIQRTMTQLKIQETEDWTWTQGLTIANQSLYHLNHSSSPSPYKFSLYFFTSVS
jgi:hypothetical protein